MSSDLLEAIERHDVTQLAALLAAGADPNVDPPSQPSWAPLKLAVCELTEGGPIEAVVLLLRNGARVDGGRDPSGVTPLVVAANFGLVEAARLLLAAGADPNVRDDTGDSPLRLAVEERNHAMAAQLLLCGADKTIHDSGGCSGMSALGRAAWGLDIPMIQLLLSAGADPKETDLDLQTAKERLPAREESDTQLWDVAAALLEQRHAAPGSSSGGEQ